MKTKLHPLFLLILCLGYLAWLFFQESKEGRTLMALATLASLLVFIGLLLGVDLYLAKRKTSVWMERYHVGLCIVLSGTVILFALMAITNAK